MRMRALLVPLSLAAVFAAEKLPTSNTPTYAKDVSRIVQKNCERCHRPGQIGPFALTSYEEVSAFRTEIKRVTQARIMPPWSAVSGHGEFRNERRLSEAEIATIAKWADAGAPLGNPKDLPSRVAYNDDWAFAKPDLLLTPADPYTVSGNGVDEYRCFVVPSGLTEDRFISAMEIRPGNRKVVHHVRVFADTTGQARKLDGRDSKPGFDCSLGMTAPFKRISIGGWAPGATPEMAPPDRGRYFPKNSDVVLEVHYHKNGLTETDQSTLGIWLTKGPVKHVIRSRPVVNPWIKIPAGAEHHMEKASWTVDKDILATSVTPHMHLLGTEMQIVATFPDSQTRDLVWAKPYDFNWQMAYIFKEPIFMPKGTRIDVTGYYNNSESNPKNPNKPLVEVKWGEATTDETLVGFIGYIDAPDNRVPEPRP